MASGLTRPDFSDKTGGDQPEGGVMDIWNRIQVGDILGLDMSARDMRLMRTRNGHDMHSGDLRMFERSAQYFRIDREAITNMWTFVHVLLMNGQRMGYESLEYPVIDAVSARRIEVVETEQRDRLYSLQAGDVVNITTGVHGRADEWSAHIGRGTVNVARYRVDAPEETPGNTVYELYQLARMVLNQHLGPLGMFALVWDVTTYSDENGVCSSAYLKSAMNDEREDRSALPVNNSKSSSITDMDFLVLPKGTKAHF